MVAFDEKPRHYAIAPAGYVHLEQAVYRLARYMDAPLWQSDAVDFSAYEGLGTSLHAEDLSELGPGYDSLLRAEASLRDLLRKNEIKAAYQRRVDGRVFVFEADWWAGERAPSWFIDGACADPHAPHAGHLADLFVEADGLQRLTNDAAEKPIGGAVAAVAAVAPSGPRKGRPPSKVPAIEQALRDEYPDGPPRTTRQVMQVQVEKRLGFKISDDSLDRARRTAWK